MLPGDHEALPCCPGGWDGDGGAEGDGEGAVDCADGRGGGPDGLGGCPDGWPDWPGWPGEPGCPDGRPGWPGWPGWPDGPGCPDGGGDPGRIRTVVSACLPSSAADTFFLPLESDAGSSAPGAAALPLTVGEVTSAPSGSAVFSVTWSRLAAAGREPGFP
ncbi:hypothetical protein [Streptosporangium sp. NPDC023615]|uniref:hypothetical protein n=1 Tax=Streptosporangium sp. NPDC023615 TaxID=3154794 RepID=UPI00342B5813